jgi:alpha,alpha-trehalase
MSSLPIADYALLSDCHSAALVSRDGSVDWLCFPRFDSPAIFARILDEGAGYWSIRPTGPQTHARRYREGSLVVESMIGTTTGEALLHDALAVGAGEREHELGRNSPHALLRRVCCTAGHVELEMEYVPRPEYGLVYPLLVPVDGGVLARGGAARLALSASVPVRLNGGVATARFRLRSGEAATFALQYAASWEAPPRLWSAEQVHARLNDTMRAWRSWSELHQSYEGPWQEMVHQSGRVLHALSFQPTGAMVAAPTTSLPEAVGGERNWDYRFTWVRDASFTLQALWIAACPHEAYRFFDFLADAALTQVSHGGELQIMFGVGGEHDLSERELPHLAGWRNSRPVRLGNAAWQQRQIDTYGELLDAAFRFQDQVERMSSVTREFLVHLANSAATRWKQPDHGIWEIRDTPRHYLHSKLMCWLALDRAIPLAPLLHAEEHLERWTASRAEIRTSILSLGWNPEVGAFTQALGSRVLDASALMIPLIGFLPGHDERVRSTVRQIADRLSDPNGLIYRYRAADGLEGEEGSFLLCTFWLAEALALCGQPERAREVFNRAAGFANDVGLLAEQVDANDGELLGNFPQAFSHIGLINAAWAIRQAEAASAEREPAQAPERADFVPFGMLTSVPK